MQKRKELVLWGGRLKNLGRGVSHRVRAAIRVGAVRVGAGLGLGSGAGRLGLFDAGDSLEGKCGGVGKEGIPAVVTVGDLVGVGRAWRDADKAVGDILRRRRRGCMGTYDLSGTTRVNSFVIFRSVSAAVYMVHFL